MWNSYFNNHIMDNKIMKSSGEVDGEWAISTISKHSFKDAFDFHVSVTNYHKLSGLK